MIRSNIMRVVLAVGSIMVIISVVLSAVFLATKEVRNVITIKLVNGETECIEFDNLALVPGEECGYIVRFERAVGNDYTLTMDFVELEEKNLKNFARVKIIADGELIYDELLATAFEDENLILPVDFEERKNTELNVIYYLPIDVGNEAKNAEAIFELHVTASNE